MKKILILLLIGSIAINMMACGNVDSAENSKESVSEMQGHTLTKIGTVEGGIVINGYNAISEFLRRPLEGIYDGNANILNYLGENKLKKKFLYSKKLQSGIYKVAENIDSKNINVVGLVNIDGEELLPCEASQYVPLSDRYTKVIYTTEKTQNEDEAILYSTDSFLSISYDKESGDQLYKGYCKIFDLEKKQFVPNIDINKTVDIKTIGSNIYIDNGNKACLYNDAGELIYETANSIQIGNDYFVEDENGMYTVYDENANKKFETEERLRIVEGNGNYFQARNYSDEYTLYDSDGNKIFENVEYSCLEIYDDIVSVRSKDYKYGLIGIDGTQISAIDKTDSYDYCAFGIWSNELNDDTYELINKDGVITKEAKSKDSSNLIYTQVKDNKNYLCIMDKSISPIEIADEDLEALTVGLAKVYKESSEGVYGVYDVITGKQLLDCEYESIEYEAGYLYAYKEEKWNVYKVK